MTILIIILYLQFAHGKEELRPARPPKIKPEVSFQ